MENCTYLELCTPPPCAWPGRVASCSRLLSTYAMSPLALKLFLRMLSSATMKLYTSVYFSEFAHLHIAHLRNHPSDLKFGGGKASNSHQLNTIRPTAAGWPPGYSHFARLAPDEKAVDSWWFTPHWTGAHHTAQINGRHRSAHTDHAVRRPKEPPIPDAGQPAAHNSSDWRDPLPLQCLGQSKMTSPLSGDGGVQTPFVISSFCLEAYAKAHVS